MPSVMHHLDVITCLHNYNHTIARMSNANISVIVSVTHIMIPDMYHGHIAFGK